MAISALIPAASIDELLTHQDADFIHASYITLLERTPDPEGMQYYLSRLRNGHAKIGIIYQLVSSSEAKKRTINITGLEQALRRYRLRRIPILGWILRGMSYDDTVSSQLRQMDNTLFRLEKIMNNRLDTIEQTIKQISYAGVSSSDAQINGAGNQAVENSPDLSHMSLSARKIYMMLKNTQVSK